MKELPQLETLWLVRSVSCDRRPLAPVLTQPPPLQDEGAYTLHLVVSSPASTDPLLSAITTPPTADPTTAAAFRPELRFAGASAANLARRQANGFATTTVHTTTPTIPPRGTRGSLGPSAVGLPVGHEASLERLEQQLLTQRELLGRLRVAYREAMETAVPGSSSGSSSASTGVSLPVGQGTNVRSRLAPAPPLFPDQTPSPSANVPTPEQAAAQQDMGGLRRGGDPASSIPAPPRTDAAAARRGLQDSLRRLDQLEPGLSFDLEPLATPTATATQSLSLTRQVIPENSLVFLLQDQFGRPHSLLVGPPGSALRHSSVYSDRLAAFQHLGHNPNHLYNPVAPGLGLQLPPRLPQMNQFPPGPQAPAPPPAAPNLVAQHDMAALRRELLAWNPHVQLHQINIPRLVRDRAAHLWLALKLVVFVLLFTGNGGWRRMLSLGLIAAAIFVWQTGLLNDVVRPLVEALYPPPPQQQPPAPGQHQQEQQQEQPLDPGRTAQLLVNRREDRMREVVRNAERALMIFMASLVPGWHDRHVNAIEQQQQQAREAEQQRQEQQQQQQQQVDDGPQPAEARGVEVVEDVL